MTWDAIIIGTGQAGVPLARALADHGWTVAIIERGPLGGTCVNTGCTPTKTMVHRAQVAHYARQAARWGVVARDVGVDLRAIVAQKDRIVADRHAGLQRAFDARPGLRLVRGHARFAGPHELEVGGELLRGDRIFINTGARARLPDVPGLGSVPFLTNATIMELTDVPEHLVVLGGGYVGLEFGQMFARFGSRVTIIQGPAQILPREDPDVAASLQGALESEGMTFLVGTRAVRVEPSAGAVTVHLDHGQVTGSHLLVATGRRPNTDDLDLGRAGVRTTAEGYVEVDGMLRTNVPGIWALGDVKGGPAFTHISYNDYQVVYANLVENRHVTTEGRLVPYCVFTDPELASVGMTEAEARADGRPLKIGCVPMTSVARAEERDETAGLMKVIVDAADDRILGATIVSTGAGETIHVLYTLMLAGLPYTLLRGAVYIHPTMAEGLYALMDAVQPV